MWRIIVWPVRLYQRFVSPWVPTRCIYLPTCSQYMIDAVKARGIVVGVAMGIWRICRCHPLAKGGYDPVAIPGKKGSRNDGPESE